MPASRSEAATVANGSLARIRWSVKSATRRNPSSRACGPASASTPAPNVNVGIPIVKPRSLPSTRAKSA